MSWIRFQGQPGRRSWSMFQRRIRQHWKYRLYRRKQRWCLKLYTCWKLGSQIPDSCCAICETMMIVICHRTLLFVKSSSTDICSTLSDWSLLLSSISSSSSFTSHPRIFLRSRSAVTLSPRSNSVKRGVSTIFGEQINQSAAGTPSTPIYDVLKESAYPSEQRKLPTVQVCPSLEEMQLAEPRVDRR